MRSILSLAAAAIFVMAAPAFAQNVHTKASSNSGAVASTQSGAVAVAPTIITGAMMGGPYGAAAAAASSSLGTLSNPQFVMGQTGVAPGMSTFNDCSAGWSGGIGPITAGRTGESEACVRQRQAQMAMQLFHDPKMAYQLMCGNDLWKSADKLTNNMCGVAAAPAPAVTAAAPAPKSYVRCSATVTDNCVE